MSTGDNTVCWDDLNAILGVLVGCGAVIVSDSWGDALWAGLWGGLMDVLWLELLWQCLQEEWLEQHLQCLLWLL